MFKLSIVTPNKKLLADQEIEEVLVPAHRGELNILPGHAKLVTTLSTGILKYRLAGSAKWAAVAISWGYCEASPTNVNILAETAETPEELDVERIGRALSESSEQLNSGELEWDSIAKYQRKYERAVIRKEVAALGQNAGQESPTQH